MLEAARYVVLFGNVIIFDIVFGIVGAIALDTQGDYVYQGCENFFGLIIILIVAFMAGMMLQSSIYLSFKFGHDQYIKIFGKCHKCVLSMCYRCVKRKQRKALTINDGYVAMELSVNTFDSNRR